jgi:hypothetical protein
VFYALKQDLTPINPRVVYLLETTFNMAQRYKVENVFACVTAFTLKHKQMKKQTLSQPFIRLYARHDNLK